MDANTQRTADQKSNQTSRSSRNHLGLDLERGNSSCLVRSYTCGFCKRGFSNAQALGGHMNIHRKDRAKLRLQSFDDNDGEDDEEIPLSLDFKNTDPIPQEQNREKTMSPSYSNNEEICTTSKLPESQNPRNVSCCPKDHKELPLFIDVASKREKDDEIDKVRNSGREWKERILRLRDVSWMDQDLDLELRLGLSPRKSSSSSRHRTSTRELL